MTVNRKNDYAFKRIFGHEDSKDILARFLSVVLKVPIEAEELTFIQTELNPEYLADKSSVLDVQVRRSDFHEKMNVEMQRRDEGNIDRRILYYWGRSFSGELKSGQKYSELPRQISIVIADYEIFDWKDPAKFHGRFHVREQEEGILFTDALEIHILELPKLRKQPIRMNALECWLLYLDNMEGEIMEQIAKQEPMIQRAMTIEEAFMKSESDRYLYELREKGRHDFDNAMSTAEKRGIAKGKTEGKAEGKAETARNMLTEGMSLELTAKITGLSIEELKTLRKV
jgi:predicted transposase/invertase (TIGR01784 family)